MKYSELQATLKDLRDIYKWPDVPALNSKKERLQAYLDGMLECRFSSELGSLNTCSQWWFQTYRPEALSCEVDFSWYENSEALANEHDVPVAIYSLNSERYYYLDDVITVNGIITKFQYAKRQLVKGHKVRALYSKRELQDVIRYYPHIVLLSHKTQKQPINVNIKFWEYCAHLNAQLNQLIDEIVGNLRPELECSNAYFDWWSKYATVATSKAKVAVEMALCGRWFETSLFRSYSRFHVRPYKDVYKTIVDNAMRAIRAAQAEAYCLQ